MNTTKTKALTTVLTPRQGAFINAYTDSSSSSFANAYQSGITVGYSHQFARNITHLNPIWLSEAIGNIMPTIEPEQITQILSGVIYSETEPTIIKLRAMELMMKYHNMLLQTKEPEIKSFELHIDLTGSI
jgi:hypothetical protein